MTILVEAGQVWCAVTTNGTRCVRIASVHRRSLPYKASVTECTKSGGNLRKARDDFKKELTFSVTLTVDEKGCYTMPATYHLVTP